MSFLHPEFIYMMLPLLIVLFALLLTQRGAEEQLFSPRVMERLRVDTKRLSSRVRNLFYFLMFLFIILALSAPVIEIGKAEVRAKTDTFFVALDISDSMGCEDLYPNRLELSKLKLLELLRETNSAQIGLLAFAKESYLLSPPTLDHQSVAFFVKGVQSSDISARGTNIMRLLMAADTLFSEKGAKKLLIISDGGDSVAFSEEIAFARERGIEVSVLATATDEGATIPNGEGSIFRDENGEPVISRLNSAIRSLAEESGGYYTAVESADMAMLSKKLLGKESDVMQKEQPIYLHLFLFLIGAAMLMLLIATSSFSRGESHHLPALLLLAAFGVATPLKASLLDYRNLEKAREAYEKQAFNESAKVYHRYGISHTSAEAIYNEANALYRLGRYVSAAELYRSIRFTEDEKNHRLYHNLGNALAKLGDEEDLKKAADAFRKALEFEEDRQSRENLAMVTKALEQKKEVRSALQQPSAPREAGSAARTNVNEEGGGDRVTQGTADLTKEEKGMSDREAQKWLKRLGKGKIRPVYKIEVADPAEGVDDDRPW